MRYRTAGLNIFKWMFDIDLETMHLDMLLEFNALAGPIALGRCTSLTLFLSLCASSISELLTPSLSLFVALTALFTHSSVTDYAHIYNRVSQVSPQAHRNRPSLSKTLSTLSKPKSMSPTPARTLQHSLSSAGWMWMLGWSS